MVTQYVCKNERRRVLVRQTSNGRPRLNGIDYLEVGADQRSLTVYFIHHLAGSGSGALDHVPPTLVPLTADNIQISGGKRLQDLQVLSVNSVANELRVRLSQPGDYSPYTLRLVQSPSQLNPPDGIDPQLASVDFRFWVEESSEFDCQEPQPPEAPPMPPPVIDYLAKDYASFRQLMLDRVAVTMPEWRERNPADVGVMVVELLAYAADHLSYYQDAAATEAYLGTCRRRVSMRRHGRLLDYRMHDGCNARTWVVFHLQTENQALSGITLLGPDPLKARPGVQLFTRTSLPLGGISSEEQRTLAINQGAQIFETLHDFTPYIELNELQFYTWGDEQCTLPKGATRATVKDPGPEPLVGELLTVGRVLVFQEVRGPTSGEPRDANLAHRHVVRLTRVQSAEDPLTPEQKIVEIEWAIADALPFDLPLSGLDLQGVPFSNPLSVVYGNVVLADAGRTRSSEKLQDNLGWSRLRPRLTEYPLTHQVYVQTEDRQWQVFDATAPAKDALQRPLRDVRPAIALWERQLPADQQEGGPQWQPQPDLLISDRFARDFVVETEEDGRAFLRFGDGTLGKQPNPEVPLYAWYRTGNGQQGNVGADTLVNIWLQPSNLASESRQYRVPLSQSLRLFNPLPAQGGVDPEPLEQVRLDAPQAFREDLRRAVTEQDYATITGQYPGVQKAIATRRWTGSWQTIFITVDRTDGLLVDNVFKEKLLAFLEGFRLSGHDLEIESPRFVPLDIGVAIQVQADYFQSSVKKALLEAFSNQILGPNRLGFFHPDNFTFGQPVYLSQLVAHAMQIDGVQSATVKRFQRWDQPSQEDGLVTGVIQVDRLEIIQLENVPSLPENGRIQFMLEGGL